MGVQKPIFTHLSLLGICLHVTSRLYRLRLYPFGAAGALIAFRWTLNLTAQCAALSVCVANFCPQSLSFGLGLGVMQSLWLLLCVI